MKKISKQAEDKLLQAIEKTAVLVNDGEDPSEAIAKVAVEDGIPPGSVNLMVHAYNTGRTTRQRVDGNDPMDKSADFPLADASQVLKLMYPDNVKTAAEQQRTEVISTEYAIPPTGVLQRREKRAICSREVDWSLGAAAPESYPTDPMMRMRKAYNESEWLQRKVAEARVAMSDAREKMAATFMELTDYFRRPEASPIPIVREQVTIMHGGKGRQVMDQLIKVTPGLMKFSKHKAADKKPDLEAADGEPYALISQLLDEVDAYKKKKAAYNGIYKDAAERSEALLRPFVQPRPRSVLEGPPFSAGSEKEAGFLTGALSGALLKKVLSPSPPKAGVESAYDELTDPAHEQQLRGIRAQAMLQDLMINDPVIAGYDPGETMGAYNEIVQMSPRAADKRLLMQGLLRKRLAQGMLDPYEVEQLLNVEEKQKKLVEPSGMQQQERAQEVEQERQQERQQWQGEQQLQQQQWQEQQRKQPRVPGDEPIRV